MLISHHARTAGSVSWCVWTFVVTLGVGLTPVLNYAQDADSDLEGSSVTFTADIAPLLQRSCQSCHRPGSIAPMSLITYEDVRPWARSIKQNVETGKMPPWFVDKTVGIQHFKDDRSLNDEEIATISRWVDGGAPKGNPADMPPPVTFETNLYEWTIADELGREPDLIVPIPEPFFVVGDSPNLWIEFDSDTGLTEDRWVKALETKPSLEGFPIVHHASTRMFQPSDPDEIETFGEYALGKTGDIHPDGTGRLMKAGTHLMWNLHYSANPTGEDTTDRTSIALWFYPKGEEPERRLYRQSVGNVTDLDLPAGDSLVRTDGYTFLEHNVQLARTVMVG